MSQNSISLEKALELLQTYQQTRQYKKSIALASTILRTVPDNVTVLRFFQEARLQYALSKSQMLTRVFQGIMAVLLVLAGLFAYQWWAVFPTFEKTTASHEGKLISLIKENGTLREKNDQLTGQITLFQNQVSLLTTGLHEVSEKLLRKREENPDEKLQQIAALQVKIDEQNNQIQQLIKLSVEQEKKKPTAFTYAQDIRNFLIVGDHGGLTDTIMIASVNPSLKTISLISVPRDLYIDGRKVNEIYKAYGRDTLQVYLHDITGLTIQHYLKVDLEGFVKVIDLVGGIDVNVPKDIADKQYPTGDGNTEELFIAKGWQHFDGTQALKYARTRHGDSDFERAKRQQQVIEITLDKIRALGIADVAQQLELAKTMLASVETDVNVFQALGFYQDYQQFTIERGNVISTSNFLYPSKTANNDYIALPTDTTYEAIQKYVYDLVMR